MFFEAKYAVDSKSAEKHTCFLQNEKMSSIQKFNMKIKVMLEYGILGETKYYYLILKLTTMLTKCRPFSEKPGGFSVWIFPCILKICY